MKNIDIVRTINSINAHPSIMQKRLPIKILFALKRNLSTLTTAGSIYQDTLSQICEQYGESLESIFGNVTNQDLQSDINQLLQEECDIDIVKVPESIINQDSDKYDALTFEELSAISFMISDSDDSIGEISVWEF